MDRLNQQSPAARKRRQASIGVVSAALLVLALAGAAAAAPLSTIYDTDAEPSWAKTINGNGASADAAMGAVAGTSGVWVGGWAGNAAGNIDATLAKFDTAGTQKWLKRYDGPAHGTDAIWRLAKGPNGAIYGAGFSQAGNGKNDILVVKWSSTGTKLWAKRYDGAQHGVDAGVALGVDKYGDVTVAGYSQSNNGADYVVVKWAANGTRRWVWRYDGSAHLDDAAADIRVESGGTTYVTGRVKLAGPVEAALTVKFARSGAKLWSRLYRGANSLGAEATCIARRPAGGIYIAGWSRSAVSAKDGLVVRYSTGGTGVALPPFTDAGDQAIADVEANGTRIIAVGTTAVPGSYDALSCVWEHEADVPGGGGTGGVFDDGYSALALDAFGGIYVAGYDRDTATTSQIMVRRASFATGGGGFSSLWGPSLGLDLPSTIAVIGTTAYVVGTHYQGAGEGWNQVVLAYRY